MGLNDLDNNNIEARCWGGRATCVKKMYIKAHNDKQNFHL